MTGARVYPMGGFVPKRPERQPEPEPRRQEVGETWVYDRERREWHPRDVPNLQPPQPELPVNPESD